MPHAHGFWSCFIHPQMASSTPPKVNTIGADLLADQPHQWSFWWASNSLIDITSNARSHGKNLWFLNRKQQYPKTIYNVHINIMWYHVNMYIIYIYIRYIYIYTLSTKVKHSVDASLVFASCCLKHPPGQKHIVCVCIYIYRYHTFI